MLRFYLILLWIMVLGKIVAQDSLVVQYDNAPLEVVEIEDKKLERFRNDPELDYTEVKAEKSWWDDFLGWLNNLFLRFFEWIFGAEKAIGTLAAFLRILPYVLLGILIYILIKFFLKVNANRMREGKKGLSTVALSEEEHIIKNEDIQQLIQKALQNKDYRLAVRYYYLLILQKMTDKELIDWQAQKTNADYLNELKPTTLKASFKKITHLYNYIWYGDFPLDNAKYQRAEIVFLDLHKSLDRDV